MLARADRLGGGDRPPRAWPPCAVRGHLPLDTATFLGARDALRADYAAAGVPMLPVVASRGRGGAEDRVLLLRDGGGRAGAGPVRGLAVRLLRGRARRVVPGRGAPTSAPAESRRRTFRAPMRLFHQSIAYLSLLFAAVAVTALLPWGRS